MDQLTATEQKVLNNLSVVRDSDVKLGDIIAGMIDQNGKEGTPVNAVAATGALTFTDVVVDGETVSIGDDVYEFLTDVAQTKTVPTNIAVNISASATKASGTLTMDVQPTSGDTVTIGTKTYIFVPAGTANADGEISIGADLAEAQAAFVAAVNGADGHNTAHPLVTAAAFALDACVITAKIGGTLNNTVATTETFSAVTNIFAAATLGSGADCSAANAITALVAAIVASDTQGVGAADGTGDVVDLTADVAGTAANAIETTTTCANATFAETTLTGGIDGTVAIGSQFLMDDTYLYVCIGGNTVADANWRRVSLGAAY